MKSLNLPFYLTGGTALSRGYFNHRYSDAIDLFTNNNPQFRIQAKNIIDSLVNNGYNIDNGTIVTSQYYISFIISHKNFNVQLKVDLVNDVAPHFGSIQRTSVYYQTDDWYNILINKITALLRLEIKDFVDIWMIAKHKSFNWDDAISNAREKELGLDPIMIAKLLKSVPLDEFTKIKWVKPYSFDEFYNDMGLLVDDLLKGDNNSLCI